MTLSYNNFSIILELLLLLIFPNFPLNEDPMLIYSLVSGSQGLWETLRILMGLPRILDEAMEDPSWLGVNRWWFLTCNFPLGMITQEAFHSLRELQMFQWKIRWGREGLESPTWSGSALTVRSTEFESEPCHRSPGNTTCFFFSQTGEHAIPKGMEEKMITHYSENKPPTSRLELSFSLCERKGHWWIDLDCWLFCCDQSLLQEET